MIYYFALTSTQQGLLLGYLGGVASLIAIWQAINPLWRRRIRKLQAEITWYQDNTLQKVTNTRYGFTVNRPLSWVMPKDPPQNNDGVAYTDPNNPEVSLLAFGKHAGVVPGVDDIGWRRQHIKDTLHAKIDFDGKDGGQIEVLNRHNNSEPILRTRQGWRFQYTYKNSRGHKIVALEKMVYPDNKTVITIMLHAPKKLWPVYQDTFNLLANSLIVLEKGEDRRAH